MAEPSAAPSRPLDVPDEAWAKAVRREAAIRPLAAAKTSRIAVTAAARNLGLSTAQLYRLIQAFRARPVTRSPLSAWPGCEGTLLEHRYVRSWLSRHPHMNTDVLISTLTAAVETSRAKDVGLMLPELPILPAASYRTPW